ncbi:MAG: WecB/TagA/CpsF family glycosyltransferase [Spirochaetaceae bacterium]|nr:MAG: WecB/TagA/CpsF family glycosyltransferase [Spirochaetaceae bacterium]
MTNRIRILDVPVDCVDEQQALKAISSFLADGERHQLVFLTMRNLFKGRRDAEFRRLLREASLILPVHPGLFRATRWLRKLKLTVFSPFSFIIRLLSLTEQLNRTVYLLGSRKEDIERAERNLRGSYPRLRLVGRYSGFFSKSAEKQVLMAIKKASPSFLMVGSGLSGRDLWVLRKKRELNPGVYIWVGDCFEVFSGKRKISRLAAEGSSLVSVCWFWLIVLLAKVFKR